MAEPTRQASFEDLFVATTELMQVERTLLEREAARVLVMGPAGSGKSALARGLSHRWPGTHVLTARFFPTERELVTALSRATREARTVVVDGLDELLSQDDPQIATALDRAAGSASLVLTSRTEPASLPTNVRRFALREWDQATARKAVAQRTAAFGSQANSADVLAMLAARGSHLPQQVVGAVEAFALGGRAAVERWLSGEWNLSEPELVLVGGAEGRVLVGRAVRMPESVVLTPASTPLRAEPLVTLGRRPRTWSREVAELEELINDAAVQESSLQRFFERNPHLLTGVDYDRVVPHPVLAREESGPLIPDFMLEPMDGAADILDLKLPSAPLVTGTRDRRRFGRSVLDALAQVREYGAYFDIPAHRVKIRERYGLRAYRPQLIFVIGRTPALDDPLQMRRLWDEMPQRSRVMTYDELLGRVKRLERARCG